MLQLNVSALIKIRFSVVSSDRSRSNGHRLKYKKFCSNVRTKEKIFYFKGDKTLEKDARRCCGVLNLGDCQHLKEHGPKQPASAEPALRWGDRLDGFQRSLPTSTIPRFCMNPKLCEHTSLVYQALINDTYTNCSMCS